MAQQVLIANQDVTAYLQYGSMTVKFNTCDFTFIDAAPAFGLGSSVVVKDPGWTGTVVQYTKADIVDRGTGHFRTIVTATNTDPLVARPTPFGLSDAPSAAAVSHYLLEDGSGALVLENGSAFAPGDYALENSSDSYGYRSLQVSTQVGIADGSTITKATATIFQPGLWPGMSVLVNSTNMGFGPGHTYVVSQITTTWTAGVPTFMVEMAASLTSTPTLRQWRNAL